MESITDKVAIVGMGCCRFGELWDKMGHSLLRESFPSIPMADFGCLVDLRLSRLSYYNQRDGLQSLWRLAQGHP